MSRRRRAEKREVIPDAKYGDTVLAKFMNSLMLQGRKSVAERIIYGAFDAKAEPGMFGLENFHGVTPLSHACLTIATTSSNAVIRLRPLTCQSPVNPGRILIRR